jgi:hypothetical protein
VALVCLGRTFDAVEAEVARTALESAGIHAFIFDGYLAQNAWYLSVAIGGMRLMVPEEQAADARALLSMSTPEQAAPDPIDTCPACGGAEVARLYSWWSLVPTIWAGLPFLFARLRRRCRICGHRWRVPAFSTKEVPE